MAAARNEAERGRRRPPSSARTSSRARTDGQGPDPARRRTPSRRPPADGALAHTEQAADDESWSLRLPGVGVTVRVEHPEQAAFYAALVTLALVDVIDWPVAAVICAGHVVARRARNRALRGIAEGMEAGA